MMVSLLNISFHVRLLEDTQFTGTRATCSGDPPLLVMFESGYCPKRLFGVLVVYLLQNKMKSELHGVGLGTEQHLPKSNFLFPIGPLTPFGLLCCLLSCPLSFFWSFNT